MVEWALVFEQEGWVARLPNPSMILDMDMIVSIDDTLAQQLREEAGRRATTTSALVEAGLRLLLPTTEPEEGKLDAPPPLPSWDSGGFRVDIADRDALYRFMEEGK